MAGEIVIHEPQESRFLTVAHLKENVQIVQRVMRDIMIEGVHYGKIPGCGDKKALLKPGAEVITAAFRIATRIMADEKSTPDGHLRYRVIVEAYYAPTGMFLGQGIGEASTAEEKYAWERAVCDEHFEDTPATERRLRWRRGKDGQQNWQEKQVRTNAADKSNTVLKMAKKRAAVDMVLSVTGCSDIFSQDLDDDELESERVSALGPAPLKEPKAKPASAPRKSSPKAAPKEVPSGPAVIGVVSAVSEKSGSGKKGPWTCYGVKIGEAWYSTFDHDRAGVAKSSKENGVPVRVVYSTNDKGYHTIEDITVDAQAKTPEPTPAPQPEAPPEIEYGPAGEDDCPFDRAAVLGEVLLQAQRVKLTNARTRIAQQYKVLQWNTTALADVSNDDLVAILEALKEIA